MSGSMPCPICPSYATTVFSSRAGKTRSIRRRRECLKCGHRFTTEETYEWSAPKEVRDKVAEMARVAREWLEDTDPNI